MKGNSGLLLIYNVSKSITVPKNNNNDTLWTPVTNNPNVKAVNHKICGTPFPQYYETHLVSSDGWIRRTIQEKELQSVPGTSDKEAIIEIFSQESLFQGTDFHGGPGGIYKDGIYQSYGKGGSGLPGDTGALWNGTSGYIRIYNYDANSAYTIIYLPPNGPQLCAFTESFESSSQNWKGSATIRGNTVDYLHPYARRFTPEQLFSLIVPPSCPSDVEKCVQNVTAYAAFVVSDPKNSVTVSWLSPNLTALAFTTSTDLSQTYSVSVPFSAFSDLRAPTDLGEHTLTLSLLSEGAVLASVYSSFSTCEDRDRDGFCTENGDCDDGDSSVNLLMQEVCDGKDNNCDLQIDEAFWAAGSKLGSPCGVGQCAGIYVCTPDGGDVVCSNSYQPGQFPEYCADGADNDCDGQVDEEMEIDSSGRQRAACVCKDDDTRSCGEQTECSYGTQTCTNGQWGACIRVSGPSAEVCNKIDDNCDGTVDNVNNGNTPDSTKCRCYGGGKPTAEACNGIDDNCDKTIDNVNGGKSAESSKCRCYGGVAPRAEACNGMDDDCNGKIDEGCTSGNLCANGVQDTGEERIDCGGNCPVCNGEEFPSLLLFAVVVIAIIAVVGFFQFRAFKWA